MSDVGAAAGGRRDGRDGVVTRAREWFGRAWRVDAAERQTMALVFKSALAATVSWYISNDVMAAQAPAFAPFSAVLVMQVTVYQSLWQALRYVGAVCVGVAVQSGLGLAIGPNVGAFAAVALVALSIGRWRRLRSQGPQVATAAFFAFSMYVSASGTDERLSQLGEIVVLVLIGCGIGLAVNMLIVPPMRYRSAEYGVRSLAGSLHNLIEDIGEAMRDGELDVDRTGSWRRRADQLRPIIDQAQASVSAAKESLYYNPRRLLSRRTRGTSFAGYEELIAAMQRVTYQVGSMARSLDQSADDAQEPARSDFLRQYAELLLCLASLTEILGELDEDRLTKQAEDLCRAGDEAQRLRERLVEDAERGGVPLGDPTRPYGVLLVEITRLTDEFRYTSDVLIETVGRARPAAGSTGA